MRKISESKHLDFAIKVCCEELYKFTQELVHAVTNFRSSTAVLTKVSVSQRKVTYTII